ncbi:MAG: VTT domain-containing protein [Nitrospinae bacterium]|nr:VTT domain-containing protein [Nitrospinota bacterium]MBF0633263.1 VTT domain-containing protein [Nitrospinota bacterium]
MSQSLPKTAYRVFLTILLLAATALAIRYRDVLSMESIQRWTLEAGAWAPAVFILAYAVSTVLFIPATPISLAGGALFGPVWGTVYNLLGATVGAMLAFAVSKYLASEWVRRMMGGRLKKLYEGVEAEGWEFVAFTRLVPVFPFNALNYALGLTPVKFTHYTVATFVFMLPSSIVFTYVGYAGKEALADSEGALQKILIALGLVVFAVFLARIVRKMRENALLDANGLKQLLEGSKPLIVVDVRDEGDFAQGHVPGAMNIPLAQVEGRLQEIAPDGKKIAFICKTDRKSSKAAEVALKGGVDAEAVKGGMELWKKLNFPVEK